MEKAAVPSADRVMLTLKRVRDDSSITSLDNCPSTPNPRHSKRQVEYGSDEEKKVVRMLRNKPWISYHDYESSSSEDESEYEKNSRSSSLPIGVIRGCISCEGCQKVVARWRPEAGCRPTLEEAPVYFPLESEFQDTLKYIASISAEAERYGICRIVPPQSWRPPCPLKDGENRETTKFYTRVQKLDKLQVRQSGGKKEKKKKRRGRRMQRDGRTGRRSLYFSESCKNSHVESSDEEDKFGFEPGPMFSLEGFEKYADQFKQEYFALKDQNEISSKSEPSVECIEGEYWRIVQHATEQVEVLYGADIETGIFGSGFPKAKPGTDPDFYESSGWNLNNIARLPGSALAFEEGHISGVLEPWLYVGMCFSSFCWHVEDHHLYSLNYLHFGSPKVWYGVPGNAASKLEETMKKNLPSLFEEQPDLLHKLVTQLSPAILKEAGVPIYRVVQRPGEFVITFPRAYHSGFNCGFNCAEAVNVAPMDWLPHGQTAIELYKQQKRKTSVSHDKLLLGAVKKHLGISSLHVREPEFDAAWQGSFSQLKVLVKVLKDRVDVERKRRAGVANSVHVKKMRNDFDAKHERECSVCQYDLHLSAIGCECTNEIYTCLEHARELCRCDCTRKYALYRHTLSELDSLVAALEEKAHAVNTYEKILANISKLEAVMKACHHPSMLSGLGIPKTPSNPVETELTERSSDSTITAKAMSTSAEAADPSHNNSVPFEVSSVSTNTGETQDTTHASGTLMEGSLQSSMLCGHETSNATSQPTEVAELGSNSTANVRVASSPAEPSEICDNTAIPCEVSSGSTAIDETDRTFSISGGTQVSTAIDETKQSFPIPRETIGSTAIDQTEQTFPISGGTIGSTAVDETETFPISGGTIWSMGLDELKAFFQIGVESQSHAPEKHENCGTVSSLSIHGVSTTGSSMASTVSMPSNRTGDVSEEVKRVEMIVLSDDEDFSAGHSVFTSSYLNLLVGEDPNAINVKSEHVSSLETENQITSWNKSSQLDGREKPNDSKFMNSTGQADLSVKLENSPNNSNIQSDIGISASSHTGLKNGWNNNSQFGTQLNGTGRLNESEHSSNNCGIQADIEFNASIHAGLTNGWNNTAQLGNRLDGSGRLNEPKHINPAEQADLTVKLEHSCTQGAFNSSNFQRNIGTNVSIHAGLNNGWLQEKNFLTSNQGNPQMGNARHLLTQGNPQVDNTRRLLTKRHSQVDSTLLAQQNSQVTSACLLQQNSEVGKTIFCQQNLQMGMAAHHLPQQNSEVGKTIFRQLKQQMDTKGHHLSQQKSQVGNAGHLKNSQVGNTGHFLTQQNSRIGDAMHLLAQQNLQTGNSFLSQQNSQMDNIGQRVSQKNSEVGNITHPSNQRNPEMGSTGNLLAQQNSEVAAALLMRKNAQMAKAGHLLGQGNLQVGNTGDLLRRNSQVGNVDHIVTKNSSRVINTSLLLTQQNSQTINTGHFLPQPTVHAGDTNHLQTQQSSQMGNPGQFLTKQTMGISLTQTASQVCDTGHMSTQTSSHAGETSHLPNQQSLQMGNTGKFLSKQNSKAGSMVIQQPSQVCDTGNLLTQTSSHAGDTNHLPNQQKLQIGKTGQFPTKKKSQVGGVSTQQTSRVSDTVHLLTQTCSHASDTSHLLNHQNAQLGNTGNLLTQTGPQASDISHLSNQQNAQLGNTNQFSAKKNLQVGIALTQQTRVGDTGHQTSSYASDTSQLSNQQNAQLDNAGQFIAKKNSQVQITLAQQNGRLGDTGHLVSQTSSDASDTCHLLSMQSSQLGSTGQLISNQKSQLGVTLTQPTSQVCETGHLLTQQNSQVGNTGHLLNERNSQVNNTGQLLTQTEDDLGLVAVISPSTVRDNTQQSNCLLGQSQRGYAVELLNVGKIMVGKAWCNKDAIFPAGFQSRVLFPSVLDPSQECFYLSEVIDWGQAGPLFKVTMNDYPSEVFVHPNINKCWQLVQKRVNMATQLHQCLGKAGLPPLREPDEVSGYELYGFTSPHIITAIESLDWKHQCFEYWAGKVSDIGFPENQFWMSKPNNSAMNFYQPYDTRLPSRIGL